MRQFHNFINGQFLSSNNANNLQVRNPATGDVICSVPESSQDDADRILAAATAAQRQWSKLPPAERAKILHSIATKIRQDANTLARTIVEEQGKTIELACTEVHFSANYFDIRPNGLAELRAKSLQAIAPTKPFFCFSSRLV
jgi:lactaldehyde dehydrogenase/glycolaldehyde dehydrogenase